MHTIHNVEGRPQTDGRRQTMPLRPFAFSVFFILYENPISIGISCYEVFFFGKTSDNNTFIYVLLKTGYYLRSKTFRHLNTAFHVSLHQNRAPAAAVVINTHGK